jgi:hypothetical protein
MKFVIWGAGERGRRIFPHVGRKNVSAFIDINEDKIGTAFLGKKVISFEDYKENFADHVIIISCTNEKEIVDILIGEKINCFFLLSECPGEFQESNTRKKLEKHIREMIEYDKRYIIYGFTLYSVLLVNWIKDITGKNTCIIPHKRLGMSHCKKHFNNFTFLEVGELKKNDIDIILDAYEKDYNTIFKLKDSGYNILNIYDCSDKIEEYHNAQIELLKNIHKGKRVFIVATGPSLRIEDLEMLRTNNEICISMNKIWLIYERTFWRPDYYVADDFRMLKDYPEELEKLESEYIFLGDTFDEFWNKKHKENILKYHFQYEYSECIQPKFSGDFSRKSYMGATVTYSCLQMAAYMGFQDIYLLGVDFSYGNSDNKKYGHFYKEKALTSKGFEKAVTLAYQKAKNYADKCSFNIYNATRGGKLEVFERVNFDDLF